MYWFGTLCAGIAFFVAVYGEVYGCFSGVVARSVGVAYCLVEVAGNGLVFGIIKVVHNFFNRSAFFNVRGGDVLVSRVVHLVLLHHLAFVARAVSPERVTA